MRAMLPRFLFGVYAWSVQRKTAADSPNEFFRAVPFKTPQSQCFALLPGCAHSFRAGTLFLSPFILPKETTEQQCPKFSVQF
jgi:hypothetical protein